MPFGPLFSDSCSCGTILQSSGSETRPPDTPTLPFPTKKKGTSVSFSRGPTKCQILFQHEKIVHRIWIAVIPRLNYECQPKAASRAGIHVSEKGRYHFRGYHRNRLGSRFDQQHALGRFTNVRQRSQTQTRMRMFDSLPSDVCIRVCCAYNSGKSDRIVTRPSYVITLRKLDVHRNVWSYILPCAQQQRRADWNRDRA